MLATLTARITRALVRAGVLVEESRPDGLRQSYLDFELNSPLEQLSAAAVRYRIAVGPLAGRKTMKLHTCSGEMRRQCYPSKPFTAARVGFSLNVGVACEQHERAKLERLGGNETPFNIRYEINELSLKTARFKITSSSLISCPNSIQLAISCAASPERPPSCI